MPLLGSLQHRNSLLEVLESVRRRYGALDHGHLWQARFYDFVVFTEGKRVEKLRYIHRIL